MGNYHPSWRDYEPPTKPGTKTVAGQNPDLTDGQKHDIAIATKTLQKGLDRGSRRGARRCLVHNGMIYEMALANELRITSQGIKFQSHKEAKRWLALLAMERAGAIRELRRQVRFSLQTRGINGLMVHVCFYVADFTYLERKVDSSSGSNLLLGWQAGDWVEIVEDSKPGTPGKGAFREDTFLVKRDWFRHQYGREIRET